MNIVEILRLGAVGLVFLLAALAFRLLLKEQAREHPRELILRSVRTFMIFAVILALIGTSPEVLPLLVGSRQTAGKTENAAKTPGDAVSRLSGVSVMIAYLPSRLSDAVKVQDRLSKYGARVTMIAQTNPPPASNRAMYFRPENRQAAFEAQRLLTDIEPLIPSETSAANHDLVVWLTSN